MIEALAIVGVVDEQLLKKWEGVRGRAQPTAKQRWALSSTFVALSTQRRCKEDSSCGNCGNKGTGSGVVGVLEVLVIARVVATMKKGGRECGGGRSTSPAMQIKYRQR